MHSPVMTTATETRRILDCRHVRGAMNEQPDVLARLSRHVEYFAEQVGELAAGHGGFRDVVFLAPPRAQAVALLGKHAVAERCGPSTAASNAAGSNAEGGEPAANPLDRRLVIALSPSGEDERVLELAQRALDAGSSVAAVTNDARSPLAQIATLDVDIAAGLELSTSPTKSVTGMMLAALALIDGLPDAGLGADEGNTIANPATALALAEAVGELLADGEPADVAAARLARARRVAVIGQGHHHPAALETARMLRETAGLLVEAFSVEEFSDGPMGGFDDGTAVVLLAGSEHTAVHELRARLHARSAHVVVIGDFGDVAEPADLPLPPLEAAGAAECILATVRGQQLAVAAARALGVDPDRPAVAEAVAPSPVRTQERASSRSGTEHEGGPGAR